jgi:dTDP-4-dehydrorhamnose 3,5-epimerase-like enzyme
LGVLEYGSEFDFKVMRIFFLRDLKEEVFRGMHSHEELKQLIVCLHGSFVIDLNNGLEQVQINMKADNSCLFVDGKVWREMKNFKDDTIIMISCDREYKFDKVVREFSQFKENLKSINYAI